MPWVLWINFHLWLECKKSQFCTYMTMTCTLHSKTCKQLCRPVLARALHLLSLHYTTSSLGRQCKVQKVGRCIDLSKQPLTDGRWQEFGLMARALLTTYLGCKHSQTQFSICDVSCKKCCLPSTSTSILRWRSINIKNILKLFKKNTKTYKM